MDLGAWCADQRQGQWGFENLSRGLPMTFTMSEILDRPPRQPLPRDVWLPDIEVVTSRDTEGSPEGLFLAAKGGHNEESHNHNDVGTYCVYVDGKPLLVDAGVETYTAKTFSPDRYDIWTMQTAYHNLVTFNGVQQEPGAQFKASNVSYESTDDAVTFSLNIEQAYPEDCGLESWRRTVTHTRGQDVVVADEYAFASDPTDLAWHLITPSEIDLSEEGWIHLTPSATVGDLVSAEGWVQFDPQGLEVTTEQIEINDERMAAFWGSRLFRINLTATSAQAKGTFTLRATHRR